MSGYDVLYVMLFFVGGTSILLSVGGNFCDEIDEWNDRGKIQDFDVSAGGFLAETKCTVETTNRKVSLEGYDCDGLATGKHLIQYKDWEDYRVVESDYRERCGQ